MRKWVEKNISCPGGSEQKALHHCDAPPNITGQLHMGHALDNTMQDILIRFKRGMQGYNALTWQPGTDHASIGNEVKIIESEGRRKRC